LQTLMKMTEEEVYKKVKKEDLTDMTVNERLVVTELIEVFDKALISDSKLAKTILKPLKVDKLSIERILDKTKTNNT
jgi:hypothetical protein